MKNIFITLILLIPIIGFSQKVTLAPEIGLNSMPMKGSDIGQNYQLGYHVGGYLKYHFSKKFSFCNNFIIF